jgi:hypothetical protein
MTNFFINGRCGDEDIQIKKLKVELCWPKQLGPRVLEVFLVYVITKQ